MALPINEPVDEAKCEDLKKVIVGDDPEKFFQVGAQLPLQVREQLVEFLRKNVDVFTWSAYEAPRIDPSFICHHLNPSPQRDSHLGVPQKSMPRLLGMK